MRLPIAAAPGVSAPDSSRYVLIVDDDPGILCVYELALADLGFTPILVSDSRDTMEQVKRHKPVLVILDERMPGLTGTELARQIRELCSVPIIIVSAGRNIEQAALDAGATAWLEKPFDVEDLISIVFEQTGRPSALTA